MYPQSYFITKGSGISKISPLNAFDKALKDAGISHLNLVTVSSILPPDIKEESYRFLKPGTIAFVILASETCKGPGRISAGLAWARGVPHGYVVEYHGHIQDKEEVRKHLLLMLEEAAKNSDIVLENPSVEVEIMDVPPKHYGSVIVALVFSQIIHL